MGRLAVTGGTRVGPVNPPSWPIFDETEVNLLKQVVESGKWAWEGPKEQGFEKKFSAFLGGKYGWCVANGTHSLRIALEALGIGPGDEVIVPGLTWQATAACCLDVNALPILVDIDPRTYCIDPKAIEAAITPRTRAIIPVHLYGSMADMDAILAIARKHKFHVIEDCAHQHGSRWRNRGAGTMGVIGSFSFQGSKVLNSGEGGFVTTNSARLHELLFSLRCVGRPLRKGARTMQSGNYRMSDFQSAVLLAQLKRLRRQQLTRDRNAKRLERLLASIDGIDPMFRHAAVTHQDYYNWILRYDKSAWDGVPAPAFRRALSEEIGFEVISTYDPLNNSPFYKPHTKKTHMLNKRYWQAIDPKRFDLPVCKKAFEEEALVFYQTLLLLPREQLHPIVDALAKLRENLAELVRWSKRTSKRGGKR